MENQNDKLIPLGASAAPLSFAEAVELRNQLDSGGNIGGGLGLIGQRVDLYTPFGLGVWRLPVRETYSIVARLAAGHITAPEAIAEARTLRSNPAALVDPNLVAGFERLRENYLAHARERAAGGLDANAAREAWRTFLAKNGIEDESPNVRRVLADAGIFRLERAGELHRLTRLLPMLPALSFLDSGFDIPHDMGDLLVDEHRSGAGYGSHLLERIGAPLSVAGCVRQAGGHPVSHRNLPERWRTDPTFSTDMLDQNVDPMALNIPPPVLAIEAAVDAELRAKVERDKADARFYSRIAGRVA